MCWDRCRLQGLQNPQHTSLTCAASNFSLSLLSITCMPCSRTVQMPLTNGSENVALHLTILQHGHLKRRRQSNEG